MSRPGQRSPNAVALVAQELPRLVRIGPAQLVDLLVRGELARQGLHLPVAHELGPALGIGVARAGQLAAEPAAHAGLLLDLPQSRLLEALAGVELALREGPVVVLRPVDQGDAAVAGHDAPGRPDLVGAHSSRTSAPPGTNSTRRTSQSAASARTASISGPVCCQGHQNSTAGPAPEIVAPTAPRSRPRSTSSIERGYRWRRRGWCTESRS